MAEVQLGVVIELPISSLHSSPYQTRSHMDKASLNILGQNIVDHGQNRPIKVRPHPTIEDAYEIGYGHRTIAALKMKGRDIVLAIIQKMTDKEMAWLIWNENQLHENLYPIDIARWVSMMAENFGYAQVELSNETGYTQQRISQIMAMLALEPFFVEEKLIRLTERQARAILSSAKEILRSAKDDDLVNLCAAVQDHDDRFGQLPSSPQIEEYARLIESRHILELAVSMPSIPEHEPSAANLKALDDDATDPETASMYAQGTVEPVQEERKVEDVGVLPRLPPETPYETLNRVTSKFSDAPPRFLANALMEDHRLPQEKADQLVKEYLSSHDLEEASMSDSMTRNYSCPFCERWTPADLLSRSYNRLKDLEITVSLDLQYNGEDLTMEVPVGPVLEAFMVEHIKYQRELLKP